MSPEPQELGEDSGSATPGPFGLDPKLGRLAKPNELTRTSWIKSSFSSQSNRAVEVAVLQNGSIAMRDGKDPYGPALIFTPAEWAAFTRGANNGEFRFK